MDRPLQEWRWLELWPLALIAIVIASWALYHFLAPRSWRDWAGAGAVQAFIIALYAEMYGFPLTIYVLTSFLHVPIPLVHGSGHLWATLLGYGSAGALVEMILGYAFVVAGLVLLTKGWRAIVHARGRLITDARISLALAPEAELLQWWEVNRLGASSSVFHPSNPIRVDSALTGGVIERVPLSALGNHQPIRAQVDSISCV